VLIVDGERVIADRLAMILSHHGYQCSVAYSGCAGLRKAREVKPDMIISDVVHGPPHGVDMAIQIHAVMPETKILLVRGQAATADLLKKAHAEGHYFPSSIIRKPVHPQYPCASGGFVSRPMSMRGDERIQDGMFSYVSLEQRVPADHPLRGVRKVTDAVLRSLNAELDQLYADSGRPSIAPEYILRALLLQVFFSIRSERLLVEQIDYNLLFRWFVGLGMDDAVWNHAVFSKSRDRLLGSEIAQRFFAEVNKQAKKFMSDEHFTVDGTLIQAWGLAEELSSQGRFGGGERENFHGQKRSNKTRESTTDPDARLYKKSYGKESKLNLLRLPRLIGQRTTTGLAPQCA
jgi:transposase